MLNVSQSNITDDLQRQNFLRIILISIFSTVPSCVFLIINGTMLFTLRSKPVFRETCRYALLYNLLLADTVQLAQSQVMFLLSVCRVKLGYSLCAFLTLLANLANEVSPLTLVVMPLERYVAVCHPLRHASIITMRNTTVAIVTVWAFSSLNNLTRLLLFLEFPFEKMESLQIKDLCSNIAIVLGSLTDEYDRAYTWIVFLSASVAVTSSYIGVVIAARSASTDKVLAHKALNTLLMHLVQLGLSLTSIIYNPLIVTLSRTLTRMVFLWIQNVFYVCFIIVPRCLSSLIYGLRDQTIRPVFLYHLCHWVNVQMWS
ncbi:odorant receptor 131-2-like [Xenentodon cancila]